MNVRTSNFCVFKGFVADVPKCPPRNKNAIEFTLTVPRPYEKDKQQHSDPIDCYIVSEKLVALCQYEITRGMAVIAKGEIRKWYDGSYKLLVQKLEVLG